jgi:hypothetical protein
MKMLIAAILMFSTVAHAEYLAPRRSELRQQAVQKNVKSERNISRASLRSEVAAAPTVANVSHGIGMDDVLSKVTGIYMTGLQRCYRKSLAFDPSVSSKIDLQFKVAPDGHVSSNLQGDGLERCLNTLISTWHFGVALDDGGMPAETSFKIALVLQ